MHLVTALQPGYLTLRLQTLLQCQIKMCKQKRKLKRKEGKRSRLRSKLDHSFPFSIRPLLMQACQHSTLRWNTLTIFAVSHWHGWSNGAVSSRWGGKMAATSSMHIFQIYCDVTEPGQTRTEPILQCVMSASLELYILRPKQSLWIHEPAVEENFSALLRLLRCLQSFSSLTSFVPGLHVCLPPSLQT